MHHHIAHPPGPEPAPSLLDNLSDTLLNAFAKVRKPDERFTEMREGIDRFQEGLGGVERLWTRSRTRTNGQLVWFHLLCAALSISHRFNDGLP
jgi:sorting nexin-4